MRMTSRMRVRVLNLRRFGSILRGFILGRREGAGKDDRAKSKGDEEADEASVGGRS